ncbi:MAG: DISARM system helicase DrmA [Thermoplasmata archaeon]
MIEELIKELYGPRYGPEEEVVFDPSTEYIIGAIIPFTDMEKVSDPDSETVGPSGEYSLSEDDSGDDEYFTVAEGNLDPKMKAHTFGLSFTVQGNKQKLEICITWGNYVKIKNNSGADVWKRRPRQFHRELEFGEDRKLKVYLDNENKIYLHVEKNRIRDKDDYYRIRISLVNGIHVDGKNHEEMIENTIFQPSIRVIVREGKIVSSPPSYGADGSKSNDLLFLYRKKPVIGRGHMCSAIWKEIDYWDRINQKILWADGNHFGEECGRFFNCDVRTEFIPLYHIPNPEFSWNDSYGVKPELSTSKLSEMWDAKEIEQYLKPLIDGYQMWINENSHEMNLMSADEKKLATKFIEYQEKLLDRMNKGIDILLKDEDARLSFCFANKVILKQHIWKQKPSSEKDGDFIWRPYQLAFILATLESIYNPDSKDREIIDLLWIPTGGGKTETYLAIMAFDMAYRRRRELRNGKNGGGTAIITRYTLRLLAIQQFRRLISMITAAEYLRIKKTSDGLRGWRPEKCTIKEDLPYGSLRFSAGIWVGGSITPNHLRKQGNAIDVLSGKDGEGEPAQIIRCPACGTYLSVPDSGLPAGESIYITLYSGDSEQDIEKKIKNIPDLNYSEVRKVGNLKVVVLKFNKIKKPKEIDDAFRNLPELNQDMLNFRVSRPGYFKLKPEPGRRNKPRDFEIYCPNPDCELNRQIEYMEGVPENFKKENAVYKVDNKLSDVLVPRIPELPFGRDRVPIPAYTVDEQIYSRCPTIIVSTVDKIARFSFEPRAASIFGNVDKYNVFYGYYRKNPDLLPEDCTEQAKNPEYTIDIKPFSPPELIIQDELHLIEGPIGSLFGLYEIVLEGIIRETGIIPKYIASTATIKDAGIQVKNLFAREVFQFPPHGLDADDNFFVRYPGDDQSWDEDRPGRIYMGVYSPGMGPLTPPVRIWARLLAYTRNKYNDRNIKYYWSIVEYFNSLRELGGGRAIYRADIYERFGQINLNKNLSFEYENIMELSSRINSTDLPALIDKLEKWDDANINANPDAIFTTSMFGTGIDIPHLSLMIVNGQPKTTTQYIQATGRIGRKHGGLVIVFFRAGRPRDLSHYELFPAYHMKILMEVEPSSVSPFSEGSLERGSGPVMVAFLRNMRETRMEWYIDDGKIILYEDKKVNDDLYLFKKVVEERLNKIYENDQNKGATKIKEILKYFSTQIDRWKFIARNLYTDGNEISFVEYPYKQPKKNVVLGDPYHEKSGLTVVFRNSPQSLREIEETVGFWM